MANIEIEKLITALCNAEAFRMPEMNEGTDYLFKHVYEEMAKGAEVYIRDLDFSRFSSDDIFSLKDIYYNIIEDSNHNANQIIGILQKAEPACQAVDFL